MLLALDWLAATVLVLFAAQTGLRAQGRDAWVSAQVDGRTVRRVAGVVSALLLYGACRLLGIGGA